MQNITDVREFWHSLSPLTQQALVVSGGAAVAVFQDAMADPEHFKFASFHDVFALVSKSITAAVGAFVMFRFHPPGVGNNQKPPATPPETK